MPTARGKAIGNTQDSWPDVCRGLRSESRQLTGQQIHGCGWAEVFPAAIGTLFDLDFALGEAPRTDQHLLRNSDQVGGGKFGSRPFVKVMIEHFNPLGGEFAVELLAGGIGIALHPASS